MWSQHRRWCKNFFVTRASHDFVHLRCSTQFVLNMKKVLSFQLVLTLHYDPYRIGRVSIWKTKKVDLYETLDLHWCAFSLRTMHERFLHVFTRLVAGQPVAEKPSLRRNVFAMWNKWWHLRRKESFGVAARGSVALILFQTWSSLKGSLSGKTLTEHSPCSYTCLHSTLGHIGYDVCLFWKRKMSICTKPLVCVGVHLAERWTSAFFTRSRALLQIRWVAERLSLWQNLP